MTLHSILKQKKQNSTSIQFENKTDQKNDPLCKGRRYDSGLRHFVEQSCGSEDKIKKIFFNFSIFHQLHPFLLYGLKFGILYGLIYGGHSDILM